MYQSSWTFRSYTLRTMPNWCSASCSRCKRDRRLDPANLLQQALRQQRCMQVHLDSNAVVATIAACHMICSAKNLLGCLTLQHMRVHTAEYMFTISLTLLDIADHALQVFELQPSYMDDLTQSAPPLAHNVHAVYQTCHTIVKQLASVSTAATLNGLSGVCLMICSCHQ